MGAFDYPDSPHVRRHGPKGYASYESYRPWLRDEFSFRCVYCLKREQWGQLTGDFDLEHFHAQVRSAHLEMEYGNLLYSCHRCNLIKLDQAVPDPIMVLTSENVRLRSDGLLNGTNPEAEALLLKLDLNSPRAVEWRVIWMRNAELSAEYDSVQYERLMGFPADLPDLSRLRPPGGNSRPQGVQESFFAQRERRELPTTY